MVWILLMSALAGSGFPHALDSPCMSPVFLDFWQILLLTVIALFICLWALCFAWPHRFGDVSSVCLSVQGGPPSRCTLGGRWRVLFWAFVLTSTVRFGEASHPGPSWSIAVANWNGLNTRAWHLGDSAVDAWIFSETHSTTPGERAFRSALREMKSPYRAFIGGAPVPSRSEASDVGLFSGVGLLSQFPARRLPHSWPDVVFRSGRIVAVSVCCHGIWISGIIIYGTPTGGTHTNGREITNELLTLAAQRVNMLSGPRFVAGDWNHDLDRLSAASVLARLGFADCQDIHAQRTGILPQATCRGKTRRDYMFMSPELCGLFDSCSVVDASVADHADLVCHFAGGDHLTRFAWPIPDQMEWEPVASRAPVDGSLFSCPSQATVDFEQFWTCAEANNNEARKKAGKAVVRAMSGRAKVKAPVERDRQIPPLKASRPGDRQPLFLGSCLQHVQWTRQLRRMQSYVRLAQAPVQSTAHRCHAVQLWTSICNARGFAPSFAVWWSDRTLSVGEPESVPVQPPGAALASLFLLGLETELTSLEKALNRTRSHAKRLLRASDAHAVFDSVKRDVPAQVDSLVTTVKGHITVVDEDECAVEFPQSFPWRADLPVITPGGLRHIIHVDSDKLWLDSCSDLVPGQEVTQQIATGSLPALFAAFEEQWSKLWHRHQHVPASQWDDIVGFAQKHLRPVVAPAPTFDVASFRRCVRRKSRYAAVGLDGVSRQDLLSLHDSEVACLMRIFAQAGCSGSWPSQILSGYVRSLAKIPCPEQVGHYRPITVFGLVYRTWSSLTARHWLKAISPLVDPYLFGSTSGGRASMVWHHVLHSVEVAHRDQGSACGFVADIVKAFNALPRYPALAAVRLLGVDHGSLCAWAGALSGFRRHFIIQGSYSPGVYSCNGFPEGCALSCLAMVALTQLFHVWVRASEVPLKPISYVDNWAVLMSSPDFMAKACETVDKFASMLHIELDAAKCYTWGSDRESRRSLRASGFRVVHAARDLGAHVVYTCQLSNATTVDRF